MRTISQAVEEVIRRSPFLVETIVEGVSNNAEIARKIQPEVEKRLLEKVSESAIAMALHRLSKGLRAPVLGVKFLKQINDITVRSNLVEFVFSNSDALSETLEAISRGSRVHKEAFVNFSRGLRESLLLVDSVTAKEVATALTHHTNIMRFDNLSVITLRLPDASLDVPGLYYPVLKELAMEGISFVEIMSVRTELSILFEDKDVDRAFSVLKRLTS